jgi:hypothetical protein
MYEIGKDRASRLLASLAGVPEDAPGDTPVEDTVLVASLNGHH